ncbi:MAG: CocE/NonD family hydrolase, partial [Candidatus Binatia bacterium]
MLRPDSQFEALPDGEGYKKKDLAFPPGPDGGTWATVMTMEGYAGATRPAPNLYLRMDDGELMAVRLTFPGPDANGERPDGTDRNFVFAQASIRGTECSGGHFNLYDHRHRTDGAKIIEWIAAQEW